MAMKPEPNHFDSDGNPRMVDVSGKPVSTRVATASGDVTMRPATAEMVRHRSAKKGDVLAVAQLAAIQATKWTQTLIPLCHSIPLEAVTVDFGWPDDANLEAGGDGDDVPADTAGPGGRRPAVLRCAVTVRTSGKTGVEMEAMTGVSVACLTVYDMLKSVDRDMTIGPIRLLAKSGGKSGDYRRGTGDAGGCAGGGEGG